jgi:predicted dehydrogenase
VASKRLRIGVIGCGLVSQVMHLPHLRELGDRFETAAVCDLSPQARERAVSLFPEAEVFDDWRAAVEAPLDAVLVATSGSHAPVVAAALASGKHVLVEKPLCYSQAEGVELVSAAERAGLCLMVGYMKRYDPAFEALGERLLGMEIRLARVTTLESPIAPYVAHVLEPAARDLDPEAAAALDFDRERRVRAALGIDDPRLEQAYEAILLSSMVHEFNAIRALLGEPSELRFADIWGGPHGVTGTLAFGRTECIFAWVDLPGIARYEQEWSFAAADSRATIRFPSPFLRNMPTTLVVEAGEPGKPASCVATHVLSYEEAFKRELVEFHAAITEGREPRTGGRDGLADVVLAQAFVRSYLERSPIERPTASLVA